MATEQNTLWLTENNADVTVSDRGGRSGTYETFLDLQTPTGVKYELRPSSQLGDRHALRVRLELRDSTGALLPDESTVKFIGQDATEEDSEQIGDSRTLRHFNNADQYNADEVFRLDINQRYTFTEDAHFKMQVDSSASVSWADSYIEFEVIRIS